MKILLLQEDKLIYMQNGDKKLSFHNIEEFTTYTGETLPVSDFIDYEPNNNLFIVGKNEGIPIHDESHNSFFERLLENIDIYIERFEDPFWGMDESQQTNQAYIMKMAEIISRRQIENNKDFYYNNVPYKSDEINIQGVRLATERMIDAAKIPTFKGTEIEGTWATADERFIPFTVGEFRKFSNYYFELRNKNFTNYTLLAIALTKIYNNGATKEQILNFNIEDGWV